MLRSGEDLANSATPEPIRARLDDLLKRNAELIAALTQSHLQKVDALDITYGKVEELMLLVRATTGPMRPDNPNFQR